MGQQTSHTPRPPARCASAAGALVACCLGCLCCLAQASAARTTPGAHATPPSMDSQTAEMLALELMQAQAALQRQMADLQDQIENRLPAPVRNRFFHQPMAHSGARVDETHLRIQDLVPNSPAAEAGLRIGDRILALNGYTGGETAADNIPVLWAFRRLNPGDVASIHYERDGEAHAAHVDVIAPEALMALRARLYQPSAEEAAEYREWARRHRQRRALEEIAEADLLGVWDGLVLWRLDAAIGLANNAQSGVLVLASADEDHPLQPGDIVTRIGRDHPGDPGRALDLLYGFAGQPLVPLEVRRGHTWLRIELTYPEAETLTLE